MFFKKRLSKEQQLANVIADKFSVNNVAATLEGNGINEMSISFNGLEVVVAWYSNGCNRDIVINGDRFFPSQYADVIFKAAKSRAKNLVNEKMLRLEKALTSPTPEQEEG